MPEAVGAGVAAADDDDVLAADVDRRLLDVAELHPVGVRQVLHRLMDPVELATGDRQVAPIGRPAGEDDRVVRGAEHLDVDGFADDRVGAELGALRLHLGEAPIDVALLHLELGDAVAQQAADAIGPLEHDHLVAGAGELLGGGEPGGPAADHGDALAGAQRRHVGNDPTLVPGAVDDLDLDLLDRHRVLVDPEHASRLARGRTEPAGELGEVVRGVETLDRVLPVVAVDEVVPVGDQVAERAPVVAERDAAIHAAARLVIEFVAIERLVHLAPVAQSHRHRPSHRRRPRPLQKPRRLTHQFTSLFIRGLLP